MPAIADLLERFRRGAELLSVATTGASNPELDHVPAPGKWTIRQIACHLADSECVGAMRFRQVIAEDNPSIIAYDEKAWAARLNYSRRKLSQVVESFRRTRADNYELLRDLPEGAFARAGTHSDRGRLTLQDLLQIYAEHAENHVKQIMEARLAYKNR
jgi:hypothetical protein